MSPILVNPLTGWTEQAYDIQDVVEPKERGTAARRDSVRMLSMSVCKGEGLPLKGMMLAQEALCAYGLRVALTVSDMVTVNPTLMMLYRKGMYLLNVYRTRESLREVFGDCQTYWTSLSMHRSTSYSSSAIKIAYQCRTWISNRRQEKTRRTRNYHEDSVGRSPAQIELS